MVLPIENWRNTCMAGELSSSELMEHSGEVSGLQTSQNGLKVEKAGHKSEGWQA